MWINQPKLSFQFSDERSSLLQRSESLLKQLDQAGQDIRFEKAMLLRQKGITSAQVGQITEVQNQLGESLNLFRELRDLQRTAFVLRDWGFSSVLLGFQNDGYKMLQECILIEQRLGDKMSLSASLSSMRETIWLIQGDYTEHVHMVRDYLLSCEETGSTKLVATAKGELGAILLRQGKFSEGYSSIRESVAMLDQIGAMAEMYLYSLLLSEAQINLGQYEEAYRRCQTILTFYRKNSQYVLMGYNLILLGWAALGLGNFAEAKQYLEEAVVVEPALRINDRGLGLASLVYAEHRLLQKDQAISHLLKALQIMIDYRMAPVFMIALPAIAIYLAENGEIERGVELYALASQFSYVANSCLFDNIAGREISRLAEQLPDDVVVAAKSRGRVRDRMSTAKELFVEFQES